MESIHSERVKWGFNGGFVSFGKEKAFAEESGGAVDSLGEMWTVR